MNNVTNLIFGILGTSWISQKFAHTVEASEQTAVRAVYSRTSAKGQDFIKNFRTPITVYTNIDRLLEDKQINAVYIASPNNIHFSQIMACLKHNKHVFVEKPAVVTPEQLQIIREILTQKPQLYFMEGIKNIFLPAFKKIESLLPQLGALDGANLVYLTSGLAGTNFSNMKNLPGVVSRKAARGVLYDLGVYLISASLSWFGKPVQVNYTAKLVDHPDGADYFGRGRLIYPTFNVDFLVGNKTSSQTVSEIYGSEATLVLDRPTHLEKLTLLRNDQKAVTMSSPKLTNTMIPEVKHFVEMVMKQNRKEMWRLFELTTTSTTILQTMRDSAGIEFQ